MTCLLKQRQLGALRYLRDTQNFWVKLRWMCDYGKMPEQFLALVIGPPKTYKTRIANALRAHWPRCTVHTCTHPQTLLEIIEYDLVLLTCRRADEGEGAIVVNIMKCDQLKVENNLGMFYGRATSPVHDYDLVPYVDMR